MRLGVVILLVCLAFLCGAIINWQASINDTLFVRKVIEAMLLAAAGLVLLLILATVVWYWFSSRLRGATLNTEDYISAIRRVMNGSLDDAEASASVLAKGASYLFNHYLATKSLIASIGVIAVAMGGLFGTVVLLQQVDVMKQQNEKLEKQVTLLEKQNEIIESQSKSSNRAYSAQRLTESSQLYDLAAKIAKDPSLELFDRLESGLHNDYCAPHIREQKSFDETSARQYNGFVQQIPPLISNTQVALEATDESTEAGAKHIGRLFEALRSSGLPMHVFRNLAFDGADLTAFDLAGARIEGAKLARAVITRQSTRGGCIAGSNFSAARAKMLKGTGTYFLGTNWHAAQLEGANFSFSAFGPYFERDVEPKITTTSKWRYPFAWAVTTLDDSDLISTEGPENMYRGEARELFKEPAEAVRKAINDLQLKNPIDQWYSVMSTPPTWGGCQEIVDAYRAPQGIPSIREKLERKCGQLPLRMGIFLIQLRIWGETRRLERTGMPPPNQEAVSILNDFTEANLKGASFAKALLTEVSFDGADLSGSNFYGSMPMGRVSFAGANLSHADLRFGYSHFKMVESINFRDANLEGAAIDGVDFGANQTITSEQLLKACICWHSYPKHKGQEVIVPQCQSSIRSRPDLAGRQMCYASLPTLEKPKDWFPGKTRGVPFPLHP